MKTYLAAFGAALFLVACAAPMENEDVARLEEQRDSLKNEVTRLGSEIMAIDDKIAELSDDISLPQVTAMVIGIRDF